MARIQAAVLKQRDATLMRLNLALVDVEYTDENEACVIFKNRDTEENVKLYLSREEQASLVIWFVSIDMAEKAEQRRARTRKSEGGQNHGRSN